MSLFLKKLFHSAIFNSCLFMLLFIGLQNSANKSKVDLLIEKTVNLPVGFIVGSSFIAGSIFGSFLKINLEKEI